MVNNNTNNNNNNFVELGLSGILKREGIVTSFIKSKSNNIVLKLNHKYDLKTIVCNIDYKEWMKSIKAFKKRLQEKRINLDHIDMLIDIIDNNYELFLPKSQYHEGEKEQQQYQDITINIPFIEWSTKLVEKYTDLQKEIKDLIPELWEPIEFTLSVRTILRIKNITLPFAGIVLGPSGGLKTTTVELYRNTKDTCYRDSFSAKSFVSHNTAIPKEKLVEIDLLPAIKDKLFLTPELSPTFSKKEDELNEILGIITRILDGHGYESQSGAQGYRGYNGNYMFVWIGAAVDVPRKVHKLLGTLGPKLYFFRVKTTKKDENDYLKQAEGDKTKGDYTKKIEKIKSKMNDYLNWFDSKPINYDTTINNNDIDERVLLLIIKLAILLKHLRGNVPVWETKDSQGSDYAYTFPSLEDPNRAITQLKNLARGHALSQGRTNITMQDIPLLIKVVLSTASKERVILFDHLLENDGKLDTISIKYHLIIAKKTALKTMTELTILGVTDRLEMQNDKGDSSSNNNAFQIQLKDEFRWFLSDEFKRLRENFGKEFYDEYVSSKQQEQKLEETKREEI